MNIFTKTCRRVTERCRGALDSCAAVFVDLRGVFQSELVTLAFPCFDGCYLPKQENEFVHKVLEELDAFQQRDVEKSVLLFPALPSRLRFLIHKTAEDQRKLFTFSVGHAWSRRVAVCYSHLRLPSEEVSSDTDGSLHELPQGWSKEPRGRSRGPKRPDKAIYVPRARRQVARESPEQPSHTSSDCCHSLSIVEESSSDTTEPPAANHKPGPDITNESVGEQDVFMQILASEPCPWPPAWDQTATYFMAMSLQDQGEEDCSSSSALPTESQSQTQNKDHTDDFYPEIIARLKVGEVEVVEASNDYSSFENVCLDHDHFAHVIEIYDFPAMFKTDDLLDAFTDYSEGGIKIKWVDNTHALGVFSSASAATQALSIRHPLLKTRTLSEGSKKAKGKAMRRAEFIQPVKARPQTDAAVARRLVTRALGLGGGSRGKRY
ncbi:R3H and coiled-coil domain-containing protein 1 [Electrophorus electricus]|uniref:R3H and coiled-coil domain-containing protein 1 n=1 Tax=Electrophorus electricus TaxID=8005 RepID=UPI0015CFFA98|nr:R3H and coiled-coil domain-containing protein 1 [Electrophorus electricus]